MAQTIHIVVITNPTLSQVVVGPFKSKRAANDYRNKIKALPGLEAVTAKLMPHTEMDAYIARSR